MFAIRLSSSWTQPALGQVRQISCVFYLSQALSLLSGQASCWLGAAEMISLGDNERLLRG